MDNYLFKKEKVLELFDKIKKELLIKKNMLQKGFDLDYKEWEYKIEFEKIISLIENIKEREYLGVPGG